MDWALLTIGDFGCLLLFKKISDFSKLSPDPNFVRHVSTEPGKERDQTLNDLHLLDELSHRGPFLPRDPRTQQTL